MPGTELLQLLEIKEEIINWVQPPSFLSLIQRITVCLNRKITDHYNLIQTIDLSLQRIRKIIKGIVCHMNNILLIERVREQKQRNIITNKSGQSTSITAGAIKWTTERNLRETKKKAQLKIQQSLKYSSQNTFMNGWQPNNLSTYENSTNLGGANQQITQRQEQHKSGDRMFDMDKSQDQSKIQTPGELLDTYQRLEEYDQLSPVSAATWVGEYIQIQINFQIFQLYKFTLSIIRYKTSPREGDEGSVDILKQIPTKILENEISQNYKDVIKQNRGQQVFSAFSKTQRFSESKSPYKEEGLGFSLIDVHDKLFKGKNVQLPFNLYNGRSNIFLSPSQVKLLQEQTQTYQAKIAKLQQFREMVKDNEKKYTVNKSWNLNQVILIFRKFVSWEKKSIQTKALTNYKIYKSRSQKMIVEELLGTTPILSKGGEVNPVEATKDAKIICFYFSMHNCNPCQEFTPIFAELYNEFNEESKQIEVIFMSGDKTQDQFNKYYDIMPWLALPKGDKRLVNIAKKYEVKGVPRLVVLKPDGTVLEKQAVQKITDEGPAAIEEYLSS